jgi:hypothetical protein
MTWADVFAGSVFFPRPPVFLGATFWDQLSDKARRSLVNEYGPSAPIDFFCFILQVHETVHTAQVGEPLLNEVVQAALWIDFLDAHDLWAFQTGADGAPLVREHHLVRDHSTLAASALAAGLDTAVMVDGIAPTDAYVNCCAAAARFDRGLMRYAEYLDLTSKILLHADDIEWLRRHHPDVRR